MRNRWLSLVVGGLVCTVLSHALLAADASQVLVLDLDRVAAELEQDKTIQTTLMAKEQELKERLAKLEEGLRTQIAAKGQEYGPDATDAQKAELQTMLNEAQRSFQQAQNEARQEGAEARMKLITAFRESVTPYAETIRKARGAAVILLKNDLMFSYDPSVEITDAVIKAMK